MNLTPKDIHEKDFQHKMRGYDPDQVDEFLDQIIVDYSEMLNEINKLKTERKAMHQQLNEYDHKKDSLNDSIISAQEIATQIKKEAQSESNRLVEEAKQYAKSLKQDADQKLQKEEAQVKSNIESLSNDYQLLKQRVLETRQEYTGLLQTQLNEFKSDDWQYFLDRHYGRQRIYPANGDEPISVNQLDTNDNQEVQSEHTQSSSEENNTQQGQNDDPVIVFPDDYKKHN